MGSHIQPEAIQAIAHSVDIPKLTDEAARALAPDVEYKLREVVQEALKFTKHSKRLKLTADDINAALRLRNVEPVYGLSSRDPSKLGRAAGHPDLWYLHDRELSFGELIEAPLPRVPLDVGVSPHWLAINGVQPRVPENAPLEAPPAKRQRTGREAGRGGEAAAAGGGSGAGGAGGGAGAVAQAGGPKSAAEAALLSRGGALAPSAFVLHGAPQVAPLAHAAADGSSVAVVPPVRHPVSRELQVYFDKLVALVAAPDGGTAAAAVAAGAPALVGLTAAAGGAAVGQRRASGVGEGGGAGGAGTGAAAQLSDAAHEALLRAALASLSSDPGLHPLCPYLVAYFAEAVPGSLRDAPRLGRLLALAGALLANPGLRLERYLSQLLGPLLTCCITKTLGATAADDHWGVRDAAARLVGVVACRYGAPYHNVLPRVSGVLAHALSAGPGAPLTTLYGGIVGLQALGPGVVATKLLPAVESLLHDTLLPAMVSEGTPTVDDAASELRRQQAWRCYGALLQACSGALYGRLLGGLGEALPEALVLRRQRLQQAQQQQQRRPGSQGQAMEMCAAAGSKGGSAAGSGGAAAADDDASAAAVLAEAWKEDSDVGRTLAALLRLFGEPFLAGMPLGELPAFNL